MKNINNTDHYLLSREDEPTRRSASSFELVSLSLTVIVMVGIAATMI